MSSELVSRARAAFVERFASEPAVVAFAPGRVNLIGEHLDYNGGTVLPMALSLGTAVALSRNEARQDEAPEFVVFSANRETLIRRRDNSDLEDADFAAYPLAAYRVWRSRICSEHMPATGFRLAIASDLPIGAGLSSSAALLVSTLRAFAALEARTVPPVEIAEMAYCAETEHIGVSCGRMDPYASAVGKPQHALWFDCRERTLADVALPQESMSVLVVDSGTRRGLLATKYNERVAECGEALLAIQRSAPQVRDLCAAGPTDLEAATGTMSATASLRAAYVIAEMARVRAFRECLETRAVEAAGHLLNASHADLRDRYQVSSPGLDALQAALVAQPACLGARLTGAGFGGCLVALVRPGTAAEVSDAALAAYFTATGIRGRAHRVG